MLLSLSFVVAAIMFYVVQIRPANTEAQRIKAEIIGNQEFISAQSAAVASVERLINQYSEGETQRIRDVIERALPVRTDEATALAQVHGILENNNLTVKSVGFSVSRPQAQRAAGRIGTQQASLKKSTGEMKIKVQFSGRYEDMKEFLKMAETNTRILNVESLSISKGGPKDALDVFNYDVGIVTYYQLP